MSSAFAAANDGDITAHDTRCSMEIKPLHTRSFGPRVGLQLALYRSPIQETRRDSFKFFEFLGKNFPRNIMIWETDISRTLIIVNVAAVFFRRCKIQYI